MSRFSVIDRSNEEHLPGGDVLVACCEGDEIIGTQHVELRVDPDRRSFWLFNMLYVLPQHRRKGIATGLVAHAVDVVRQIEKNERLGTLPIESIVHIENTGSIRALQESGFEVVDDGEMTMLTWRRVR